MSVTTISELVREMTLVDPSTGEQLFDTESAAEYLGHSVSTIHHFSVPSYTGRYPLNRFEGFGDLGAKLFTKSELDRWAALDRVPGPAPASGEREQRPSPHEELEKELRRFAPVGWSISYGGGWYTVTDDGGNVERLRKPFAEILLQKFMAGLV